MAKANYTIPKNVKIIMAISAIFMPIFLIIPIWMYAGTTPKENFDTESLQAARLAPVGTLTLSTDKVADADAAPVALDAQKTYDTVCAACHGTGVSGAPKFGDTAAWEEKIKERGGAEQLAEQAIKGINAMPPKGGTTLSDDDFKKMVAFMLENAKLDTGSLPKAGAENADTPTKEAEESKTDEPAPVAKIEDTQSTEIAPVEDTSKAAEPEKSTNNATPDSEEKVATAEKEAEESKTDEPAPVAKTEDTQSTEATPVEDTSKAAEPEKSTTPASEEKVATAENATEEVDYSAQEKIYTQTCKMCHAAGVAGAPKLGDTAVWQAKIDERGGITQLAEQAIKGVNAMPPKGGATISDEEFKKVVAFMLHKAGITPEGL